jgi:DNA-directed RNA polymerase subunit L
VAPKPPLPSNSQTKTTPSATHFVTSFSKSTLPPLHPSSLIKYTNSHIHSPSVEFCGYSIPHPAEAKMHLRIQTYDNVNVQDVLDKGLTDLMELCDVVVEKFEDAQKDFKAKNGVAMEA